TARHPRRELTTGPRPERGDPARGPSAAGMPSDGRREIKLGSPKLVKRKSCAEYSPRSSPPSSSSPAAAEAPPNRPTRPAPASIRSSGPSMSPPIRRGSSPWGGEMPRPPWPSASNPRSEEHTSELQSRFDLVCRLLLEKKNTPNFSYSPQEIIARLDHDVLA